MAPQRGLWSVRNYRKMEFLRTLCVIARSDDDDDESLHVPFYICRPVHWCYVYFVCIQRRDKYSEKIKRYGLIYLSFVNRLICSLFSLKKRLMRPPCCLSVCMSPTHNLRTNWFISLNSAGRSFH
jgi:hypothetical protein